MKESPAQYLAKQQKKLRAARRVSVTLSEKQLHLLRTEMSTNASCCDDRKLADEYGALEDKFKKAIEKL